jgi:hypothetical protein
LRIGRSAPTRSPARFDVAAQGDHIALFDVIAPKRRCQDQIPKRHLNAQEMAIINY